MVGIEGLRGVVVAQATPEHITKMSGEPASGAYHDAQKAIAKAAALQFEAAALLTFAAQKLAQEAAPASKLAATATASAAGQIANSFINSTRSAANEAVEALGRGSQIWDELGKRSTSVSMGCRARATLLENSARHTEKVIGATVTHCLENVDFAQSYVAESLTHINTLSQEL